MSNFNYMDNVPVKIAEKYKPPTRIKYQSLANKFNLPDYHYENNPQYTYDFQLERKVLAKLPAYKRQRQLEREARQERREKREQEQQRKLEEQHKRLLGAVSYPNAEELSSSDSDAGDNDDCDKIKQPDIEIKDANWLARHCFDNILQPTVVSHNGEIAENSIDDALALCAKYKPSLNKTTGIVNNCGNSNKLANTFNYKDFEDDTSSPFDNIELKTINDLDILRQVLHNTQLTSDRENDELEKSNAETENSKKAEQIASDISTLESTKAALDKVNFSDINLGLEQQNDNIPNSIYSNIASSTTCYMQPYLNGIQDPNNYNYQVYQNQNYIYSPNCNSIAATTRLTDYSNINNVSSMVQQYSTNQANNLSSIQQQPKNAVIQQIQLEDELQSSKSKSVPDLFQELRDEVRNSEMRRRSRNYSHNFDGSKEIKDDEESEKRVEETKPTNHQVEKEIYNKLEPVVQVLAENISSMGFPLERVAKVARIYGKNDKKIVEHLIPLTELLDLGFEEKEISEALLKFDNNKEKALESLIS